MAPEPAVAASGAVVRVFGALGALAILAASAQARPPKVIYGVDDRKDLYEVRDPMLLRLADSTVGLFDAEELMPIEGGWALKTELYSAATLYMPVFNPDLPADDQLPLWEGHPLCQGERFYDQPLGPFCSGFLIAPDRILTAGHCVRDQEECAATKFVFGFAVRREGEYPSTAPTEEVYDCAELVERQMDWAVKKDYALIRLDRPVAGHEPIGMNVSAHIPVGTPLVVIGHPSGLPTKIADNGAVRDDSPVNHFMAAIDAFHGNSGSGVFNRNTGLIEGIISFSYDGDYAYDAGRDCWTFKAYDPDGGTGIGVVRLGAIEALGLPRMCLEGSKTYFAHGCHHDCETGQALMCD